MDGLDMNQKQWYELPGEPPPKLPPSTESKNQCNVLVVNNLFESHTYRFVCQSQSNFQCTITCI